jgi:spore coat protein CotH
LVSHAPDKEFDQRVGEFLDLDEFARFLAGLVLLSSYDGFLSDGQNFYVYLDPRSNRFGFIPWDLDHAWGGFYLMASEMERERASIWHPWTGRNRFLERVMAVKEFRRLYRAQLEELLSNVFVPSRLSRRIDELAQVIRAPIAAESSYRLERFDQAVSEKWTPHLETPDQMGPDRPVHQLKHFIEARAKSVRAQLDGKSKGVVIRH